MDALSQLQKEALAYLVDCFEEYQWDYALIGATGLISQGIKIRRVTQDLDFAIIADINPQHILMRCGLKRTKLPHRYQWRNLLIDIIPIKRNTRQNIIYWPTGQTMSVAGFREAIEYAKKLEIPTNEEKILVNVAPIPIIVLMKLIACAERVDSWDIDHVRKHFRDVAACLKQYEYHSQRRFDYMKEVGGLKDEFECAGAFLLGSDLRNFSSEGIDSSFCDSLKECCSLQMSETDKNLFECLRRGFRCENIEECQAG